MIPVMFKVLFCNGLCFYLKSKQNSKYNNLTKECLEDGGLVIKTEEHLFSSIFECVKDGKFINQIK